jgi:hypothetical protein
MGIINFHGIKAFSLKLDIPRNTWKDSGNNTLTPFPKSSNPSPNPLSHLNKLWFRL